MNRNLLLLVCVSCALLVATTSANAQTTPFSSVASQVRIGDTLTVTDSKQQVYTGKLADATSASVTLFVKGEKREFQETAVRKMVRRDSSLNGALIGFAAGAVPGALLGKGFASYCENEASSCSSAPILLGVGAGLIGALIGNEIDRHINAVLFESLAGSASVRIMPVVARQRRGVALSIAF